MPKTVYKVPATMDRSYLDHEILLSGGGFNAPPIAMKAILFWLVSLFALFWVVNSTWISSAAWYLIVLVIIWWLAATYLLGRYGKTKELAIMTVPAFVNYVPPANRKVVTRTNSSPGGFYSILNIDDISESGYITFADGTVGQSYMVVGSASILVFEEDKTAILRRVDTYWRKSDVNVEHIWMTTKEPQRVWRQNANLERTNQNLKYRNWELYELMDERFSILNEHVGGSFNSIHQYLILKGDNDEALTKAAVLLDNETNESGLFIKECSILDQNDTREMMGTIYQSSAGLK